MSFLDDNYKIMIALTLAGVLYLVWREANLKVSKADGLTDGASNTMRILGTQRSDGYAQAGVVVQSENNSKPFEGFGAYEPPVFWNAGSYAAIRGVQKGYDATPSFQGGDGKDDGTQWMGYNTIAAQNAAVGAAAAANAEGMIDYSKLSGDPYGSYEGMENNRFSDANLNNANYGF